MPNLYEEFYSIPHRVFGVYPSKKPKHVFDDLWIAIGDTRSCRAKHINKRVKSPFVHDDFPAVSPTIINTLSRTILPDMEDLVQWNLLDKYLAYTKFSYVLLGFMELVSRDVQVHRVIGRTNLTYMGDPKPTTIITGTFIVSGRTMTRVSPEQSVTILYKARDHVVKSIVSSVVVDGLATVPDIVGAM